MSIARVLPLLAVWLVAPTALAATCPADMSVETGPRTIVTARAPTAREAAAYKKITASLVPTHTKVPSPKLDRTAESAIAAVLAIEQSNPKLIPAGFRAEVAARPRDANVRRRLGECELLGPATRRRASYDLALALLLGGDAATLQRPLEEATRNEGADDNTSSSCSGDDCRGGAVCWFGECKTQMGLAVLAISKPELAIEDALSRALYPRLKQQHGASIDDRDAVFWFLKRRLHQCGTAVCSYEHYETKLVEWDRRDGGAALRGPKLPARLQKCADATGFEKLAPCMQDCVDRHQDASCFRTCGESCALR